MEWSMAVIIAENTNNDNGQNGRNFLEGSDPRVQLRETRFSYFLDVNLPGMRKEDIWLQMDNTRALIIHGRRNLQEMGMVEWTWQLVERGGPRMKPFRVPRDVNVASVSATFRHGTLHVVMPKFRWSRFSPYQSNNRSSGDSYHRLYPSIETIMQGSYAHQAGRAILQPRHIAGQGTKSVEEFTEPERTQDIRIEMERSLPIHLEEDDQINMSVKTEEHSIDIPAEDQCLESQRILEEETKEEVDEACNDFPSENTHERETVPVEVTDQEKSELPLSSSNPEITEVEAEEATCDRLPQTSAVSNADAKEGIALPEEEGNSEKGNSDRRINIDEGMPDECVVREKALHSQQESASNKSLSDLFSSIASMAARKFRRG